MKLTTTLMLSAAITVAALSLSTPAYATTDDSQDDKDHKVTICHATNSATNPYVKITIDAHAAVKAGHAGHNEGVVATSVAKATEFKAAKITWGDVIPAIPDQNFTGLNWNGDGKALLNHNCAVATVTPANTESTATETKPGDKTGTKTVASATSTPSELPQTGAVSSTAHVLGIGSLVTASTYYLASRRVRQ